MLLIDSGLTLLNLHASYLLRHTELYNLQTFAGLPMGYLMLVGLKAGATPFLIAFQWASRVPFVTKFGSSP